MVIFKQLRKDLIQLAIVVNVLIDIAHTQESPSSPLLSALVPEILQNNYQLTSTGNIYNLRIEDADGAGFRGETVELKFPGTPEEELTVNGVIKTYYFEAGTLLLTVTYEADKNGYRAKFKLEPFERGSGVPSAGIAFLKSAAG